MGILLNKNFIIAMTAIALLSGVFFYGLNTGKRIERGVCNSQKQETINENIEIRELQDNVARPSDLDLIDQLRRETF